MDLSSLDPELLDAGKAIGLIGGDDGLDDGWFNNPTHALRTTLSDPTQRAALFSLLDRVLPPQTVAGAPSGEKWHPLLGSTFPNGNLYLTLTDPPTDPVTVGLAGAFQAIANPKAQLLVRLPLVSLSGSAVTPIVGTATGPFALSLDVDLSSLPDFQGLTLSGISASFELMPLASPPAGGSLTLRGLDLGDGAGPHDVVLGPADFGGNVAKLLLALVHGKLNQIAATAGGEAKILAEHLPPLLGLDGSVPLLPIAQLAADPQALLGWLKGLLTDNVAAIQAWVGHLAALLGAQAPAVATVALPNGTRWTVPLVGIDANTHVNLVLELDKAADAVTPVLRLGLSATVTPGAAAPVQIQADLKLLAITLAGSPQVTAFPLADLSVSAPPDGQPPLIAAGAGTPFSLDGIRAGVSWDGASLKPLVELRNVVVANAGPYALLDLSDTKTVAAAASNVLVTNLLGLLGNSPAARNIAALAGLLVPSADAAAPLVDFVQLATHPTTAIAQLHRQALLSAAHPWSNYLNELALLLGLPAPAAAPGTAQQPWTVNIATVGPLQVQLIAWNAQTSGNAADPQQLRIALRLLANAGPTSASWTTEVLSADLAASGPSPVRLLGGHHGQVTLTPGSIPELGGVGLSIGSVSASLDLVPGAAPVVNASLNALQLTTPAGNLDVPVLKFPFAGGFSVANPAALGLTAAQLDQLIGTVLVRELGSTFGGLGVGLAALTGLSGGLPGLQADFPLLTGATAAGALLQNPLAAFQAWLRQVGTGASADGSSFIEAWLPWLAGLVSANLPGDLSSAPDVGSIPGSGRYDDPWLLPIASGDAPVEALLWLDPAGAVDALTRLGTALGAATDFNGLMTALATAYAALGPLPAGMTPEDLAAGLQALANHLTSTDGVVPVSSQLPTGGAWLPVQPPIPAAHPDQPADPTARNQILTQVNAWAAPGSNRVILLLGPAFSDHTTWATLLQQAEAANAGSTNPAATFNLRVPGVAPASIDLRPVTVVTDYYTADLADDGSGDVAGLSVQIGLVVARLLQLRPGAQLILVAHSTAGIAARAYTQTNSAQVRGLITLGTPHQGAPLAPLIDPTTAEGLRLVQRLFAANLAAGELKNALAHLAVGLDGYLPPAAAGQLPTPAPYPVGSFGGSASTDTGNVPALALGGTLGGAGGVDLLAALKTAAAATIAAEDAPAAPGFLGVGVRAALDLGPDGDIHAGASLRLDVARFALSDAAVPPARAATALSIDLSLLRPGGWLAGGALSFAGAGTPAVDVRVRSARMGVVLSVVGGQLSAAPYAQLQDAAVHGNTIASVALGDASFAAALGSVFSAIASPTPTGNSPAQLLAALQAYGIVAPTTGGGLAVVADALTALTVNPLTFLQNQMSTALASQAAAALPGFTASGNSFVYAIPGTPLEFSIGAKPATAGLATTGSGISLSPDASLAFSASLALASGTPNISTTLTVGPAQVSFDGSTLSLAIPPALQPLTLYPAPNAATVATALDKALPWLLIESAASAALESLLPAGTTVSGVVSFLTNPGAWLVQASALGDGTVLDPTKVNALLALLGTLPAQLTLSASGTDPTTVSLGIAAPIGGIVGIALGLSIDRGRHLSPAGTVTLQIPLPGGGWPDVGIGFGVSASGISLSVTPGGGATPIQLLPNFSGSAALAGAAAALLPAALDGITAKIVPDPANPPALPKLVLEVAQSLDLYDSVGGFAAHANQLTALTDGTWFASVGGTVQAAFINAAVKLFNDAASPIRNILPGALSASGNTLQWAFALPAAAGKGNIGVLLGWDGAGPAVGLTGTGVQVGSAPVVLDADFGFRGGKLAMTASLGFSLADSLHVSVVPTVNFGLSGSTPTLTVLPLGSGTDGTLELTLLPAPSVTFAANAPVQLATNWAVPLVSDLLIQATGAEFETALWAGGPDLETLLNKAGLLDIGAGPAPGKYSLHTPLPASVGAFLSSLFGALTPVSIKLVDDPELDLEFTDTGNTLGIGLLGSLNVFTGPPGVALLFGKPATWLGPNAGITLDLFDIQNGFAFAPALHVRGLGVGVSGQGDDPLINESGFRIGAVDGYVAFDIDLLHGQFTFSGGGLEIDKLGLPLNLLDSGSSSNPVASSLLDSNGGSGSGDTSPPNPGVDVIVYSLDGGFTLQLQGTSQPIVIPVHAGFGPIYIDQLEVGIVNSNNVSIGVDGSVQINGLEVGVIDLGVQVPLPTLTKPSTWSLDLQGLAVAFSGGPVTIDGGLSKMPVAPIEYDGMLSVTVTSVGFSIVGSYARPSDAQGAYTSLFMFVAIDLPLGGPPFAFITGLGGGFGYNRALEVPTDIDAVDTFALVAAIDDGGLANDPMQALLAMAEQIPPRRGAYWIAAGVRLTTFELVNSIVIVVVALDRGFEIDVLGISRMALPTEDEALVSVELALKARYNSEESILSVQAQLTDNSYLFSRDCQLTGGFAFFMWFKNAQFVLTLGGYNPVFSKPPEFPDVPRLGFNWDLEAAIVIKGGAYFALTNSCVMAGGSLSATASIGPVSAWFNCYVDFLVAWDPFAYEFDIGVEIGASFSMRVCFFACATISMSISVGAQLQIAGPPFHGTATIDAYITTITIEFGDPPSAPPYITDWNVFAQKYLTAGTPDGVPLTLQFSKGLLTPNPPGASPQPGTQTSPWQVGIEFAFASTTRMPANQTQDFITPGGPGAVAGINSLDLAPMDQVGITSVHKLSLSQRQPNGSWQPAAPVAPNQHFTVTPNIGLFPEATWHWVDPQHIPAAARTIQAVSGLNVDAHVVLNDQSALIPISTLVADLPIYALPLPFATTASVVVILQEYGTLADTLSASIATATSNQVFAASAAILAGGGVFSQNRDAVGFNSTGLSPLGKFALINRRAAPPAVLPITTGLTMRPVGLPAPTLPQVIAPVTSVILSQPRLKAVLQRTPTPKIDTPPALSTTVARVASTVRATSPRMQAPGALAIPGARLIVVPAANAQRPTTGALATRGLRNAAQGQPIGPAYQQALDQASANFVAAGVTLAGGAAHLWELPSGGGNFNIEGAAAFRVVCADQAGAVLSDTEYPPANSAVVALAANAAYALVESLGVPPAWPPLPASGFGAISNAFAPAGQRVAVGWQSGSTLLQIGPTRLLGRGATLRLPKANASQRLGRKASFDALAAGTVLSAQTGVETQLPAGIDVVLIALDLLDAGAASQGDLAIGVDGATLAASPARVTSSNRRLLAYDIATRDTTATSITVSVASGTAWRIAGVIGVQGSAAEWATQLSAGIPAHFVPDGPLTPDGELTVRYQPGAPA